MDNSFTAEVDEMGARNGIKVDDRRSHFLQQLFTFSQRQRWNLPSIRSKPNDMLVSLLCVCVLRQAAEVVHVGSLEGADILAVALIDLNTAEGLERMSKCFESLISLDSESLDLISFLS